MRTRLLLVTLTFTAGCQVQRMPPARADSVRANVAAGADTVVPQRFLLGLRTAKYSVRDLSAAKTWYREVTGIDPYFDEPYYVGFNLGGFELGLVPDQAAGERRPESGVAYWGVENASAAWDRLVGLGATPHEPIEDVGGGVRIGSVHDPFGNVLGIVENPAFRIAP